MITLQVGSIFSFAAIAILVYCAVRFVRLTKRELVIWIGSAVVIGLATFAITNFYHYEFAIAAPTPVPIISAKIPPITGSTISLESWVAMSNTRRLPKKNPIKNPSDWVLPKIVLCTKHTIETIMVKRPIVEAGIIAFPATNMATNANSARRRHAPPPNPVPNSSASTYSRFSLLMGLFKKFAPRGEGVS